MSFVTVKEITHIAVRPEEGVEITEETKQNYVIDGKIITLPFPALPYMQRFPTTIIETHRINPNGETDHLLRFFLKSTIPADQLEYYTKYFVFNSPTEIELVCENEDEYSMVDRCEIEYVALVPTEYKYPAVPKPLVGTITDELPNGDIVANFDKDEQEEDPKWVEAEFEIKVGKTAATKTKGVSLTCPPSTPVSEEYKHETRATVTTGGVTRDLAYGEDADIYWSKTTQLKWNDSANIKQNDILKVYYKIDVEPSEEPDEDTGIVVQPGTYGKPIDLGNDVDVVIPPRPPADPEPEPLVDVPKGEGIDYTSSLRPRISEYMKKFSAQRITSLDINVDEKPKVSFDGVELEEDYDVWEKSKRVIFKLNNGEVVISGGEKLKGSVSPDALDDVECGRHTLRIILASGYADFYIDVIPYDKYKIDVATGNVLYQVSVTLKPDYPREDPPSDGGGDSGGGGSSGGGSGSGGSSSGDNYYSDYWNYIPSAKGYEKFDPYNRPAGMLPYDTMVTVEYAKHYQEVEEDRVYKKPELNDWDIFYIKCPEGENCRAYQKYRKSIDENSAYEPEHYHTYQKFNTEYVPGSSGEQNP